MKRVAALYDVHGNLPALEAVLDDVRAARVDAIVIGGDILPGPLPREVFELLQRVGLPTEFITGNCEVGALAEVAGRHSGVPEPFRALMRWSGEQLTGEQRHAVARWPKTLTLEIERLGSVLFCHGTPRDENEIFTRVTPEERVLRAFAGVTADLVVCGHTHMQFDRTVGSYRVVNAGSVGMPFQPPAAYWLLLGPDVQLRHTNYDLRRAADRIRASAYPDAEAFAANELLNPKGEQEMTELFERAAISS